MIETFQNHFISEFCISLFGKIFPINFFIYLKWILLYLQYWLMKAPTYVFEENVGLDVTMWRGF
jgi:hypothetical protein